MDAVTNLEAKRWVDSLEERWRLQVLQKRFKLNEKTGERKELPLRIRRFVEGIPWAQISPSVKYLLESAPYHGIIFNGVELGGEYKPTLTSWARDRQDKVNEYGRKDATYTLTQDLLLVGEEDSYSTSIDDSCTMETLAEYHWDEPDIQELPASQQGVVYGIQGIQRQEDGTFNYIVTKRITRTQHTEEYITKDDKMSTVKRENWRGLYGEPGAFVDELGNKQDVPEAGLQPDGTLIEVELAQAEDCTYTAQAITTDTKAETVQELTAKTQFEHTKSVEKTGQDAPLEEAPKARGGVIKTHTSQLQPDGKYQTTEKTDTEKPVEDAVVDVSVNRRGKTVRRQSRNQSKPADTSKVKRGESISVEKTPGGLFNNTVSTFDESERMKVGETCTEDQFKHQHSRTEAGVDEIPGADDHVEGSGKGGLVVSRRTDMDDSGAISQTITTEQEKTVENASESWTVGLRGIQHRVETQQTPTPLTAPRYSRENIGTSVSNTKTPGGLYNTVTTETAKNTDELVLSSSCTVDAFQHSHVTEKSSPTGDVAVGEHVEFTGDGTVTTVRSQLSEDGTVVTSKTVEKELLADDAVVTVQRTPAFTQTTRLTRHAAKPVVTPKGLGSVQSTLNKGGTYDVSITSTEPTGNAERHTEQATVFTRVKDRTVTHKGVAPNINPKLEVGDGKSSSFASRVDQNGIVTNVTTVEEEIPVEGAVISVARTPSYTQITTTNKNSKAPQKALSGLGTVQNTMNKGGTYDVTMVETVPTGNAERHTEQATVFSTVKDRTVTRKGEKPNTSPKMETGNGKSSSFVSQVDSYGIVTDVTSIETEKSIPEYRVEVRKTPKATITTTTNKSSKSKDTNITGKAGSKSFTMTKGGLYDVTEVDIDTSGAEPDQHYSSATFFLEEEDEVTVGQSLTNQKATAGDGKYQRVSEQMDDNGIVTTTVRNYTEKEGEYKVSIRKTASATITTTTTRNTDKTAKAPTAIGETQEHTRTDGGKYDFTEVKVEPNYDPSHQIEKRDLFSKTLTEFEKTENFNPTSPPPPKNGVITGYEFTTDEYGVATKVTTTNTELAVDKSSEQWVESKGESRHVVVNYNTRNMGGKPAPVEGQQKTVFNRRTPGDLYVVETTETEKHPQELTIKYDTRGRSATYKWWTGQRTGYSEKVADGFADSIRWDNSISAQLDETGLETGSSRQTNLKVPKSRKTFDEDDHFREDWDGKIYKGQVSTTRSNEEPGEDGGAGKLTVKTFWATAHQYIGVGVFGKYGSAHTQMKKAKLACEAANLPIAKATISEVRNGYGELGFRLEVVSQLVPVDANYTDVKPNFPEKVDDKPDNDW